MTPLAQRPQVVQNPDLYWDLPLRELASIWRHESFRGDQLRMKTKKFMTSQELCTRSVVASFKELFSPFVSPESEKSSLGQRQFARLGGHRPITVGWESSTVASAALK